MLDFVGLSLLFIFHFCGLPPEIFTLCFSCYVPHKVFWHHSLFFSADIWSLGVILFMLVCGQPPFQEANDSETLTMIMDCKYTVPPHISHACREWVTRTCTYTSHKWTEYSAGAAYFMFVDVWRKRRAAPLLRLAAAAAASSLFCFSHGAAVSCSTGDAARSALSVSNAPFKIGPLFLTLWGFNDASGQSDAKNSCRIHFFERL